MNTIRLFLYLFSIVLLALVAVVFLAISTNNSYVELVSQHEQQQKNSMNVLDSTRNTVRESAQVSDREVEALITIITGYSEARGSNPQGGSGVISLAAVQEAVPSIQSIQTLTNLQNIVSASRTRFERQQTLLLDIERQANVMYRKFPSGVILRLLGQDPVTPSVIVTSTATQKSFETGTSDGSWLD